jgi:hypothetical protein
VSGVTKFENFFLVRQLSTMNYVISEFGHAVAENMRLFAEANRVEKYKCTELSLRLFGYHFPNNIENLWPDLPIS